MRKTWFLMLLLFAVCVTAEAADPKAKRVRIEDEGEYYAGDNVEAALQEIGAAGGADETDPQVGAVTESKICVGDGDSVECSGNLSSTTNDILSDTGTVVLGGTGVTNNENLTLDFETTANKATLNSTTDVDTIGIILNAEDDFEQSVLNLWHTEVHQSSTIAISGTQKYAGNYGVKTDVVPDSAGVTEVLAFRQFTDPIDSVTMELFVYIDDATSITSMRILNAQNTTDTGELAAIRLRDDSGQLKLSGNYTNGADASITNQDETNVSTGTWYHIKMSYYRHATDGYFKWWFAEGAEALTLKTNFSGDTYGTYGVNRIYFGSQNNHPDNVTLYFDNVTAPLEIGEFNKNGLSLGDGAGGSVIGNQFPKITFNTDNGTDGNIYWNAGVDAFILDNSIRVGYGGNTDYSLIFDATASNGKLTWMEDEVALRNDGDFILQEEGDSRVPDVSDTDPHLRVYSADSSVATDYIEMYHDQTDGNIAVGSGDLKLGTSGGNVTVFEDEDIGATTDGNGFYVYRTSSADGGNGYNYWRFYHNQYEQPNIFTTINSGSEVQIMGMDSTAIHFVGNADYGLVFFNNSDSGENQPIKQYGYIAADTAKKYIQWQVSDTTDNFELTREDSNIGAFDIQMPLITDAITMGTGSNFTLGTTQWNSGDEIDGTKIKDADYGDISVSAEGVWSVDAGVAGDMSKAVYDADNDGIADDAENVTCTGCVADEELASVFIKTGKIEFVINGGGAMIAAGASGHKVVPFAGTITKWEITSTVSGSVVVDVKKSTYAGFDSFATIAGSEKPTLSAAQKNTDTSLDTWTTAVSAGDRVQAYVDSADINGVVVVTLYVTPT